MKQCFWLVFLFLLGMTPVQGDSFILHLNCSEFQRQPGEAFHPYRSLTGSNGAKPDFCVECRCDETLLRATCSELKCPELRCQKVIQKEGECCKTCDTLSGMVNSVRDEYVNKCKRGGRTNSDLTVIPSLTNPCEVCYCWEGEIICESISRSCPKPRCRRTYLTWDENQCCPRCLSTRNSPASQSKTCTEHGITYQDGDTWNPYYPRFGVLDCFMCTCKDARKTCQKVPCPEVRACTDDDPYEDVTICCPKCSRILTEQNNATSSREEEDKKNSTYKPPVLVPDPPTPTQCKNKCSHNVYKSVDALNDQIAVESKVSTNVDVYVWSHAPEVPTMLYETYTSKYFRDNFITTRFIYIGCATQGSMTMLHSRFNSDSRAKNLTHCQKDCAEIVIEILKPVNEQEDTEQCN